MTEDQQQIWNSAVRMLSLREHSRHELRRKLVQRHFDENDIDRVLDRLQAEGLQNDTRFVEQYIRSRSNKGYGPTRIRMELKEKGVSDELSAAGLGESGIDWFELIKNVKNKKFKGKMATDWNGKSRQMKFLEYRGFTHEQIRSCVDDSEYD